MRVLFSFIFFFILVLSCKHEPNPDDIICNIDGLQFTREQSIQQMKDYLLFDVGTQWIYEEETTGALDTVTVYYSWEGIAQDVNEAFRMDTYSSYYDFNFIYTFNESFDNECSSNENCICYPCKRVKTKPGNFIGESNNFIFPLNVGNMRNLVDGGLLNTEAIYTDYVLDSLSLPRTVVFYSQHNLSEDNQTTRFFVSKNLGISRKELLETNQIWNLIEYSIIR